MKNHKTSEPRTLWKDLGAEFDQIDSLRELALSAHLYIEYYINQLLVNRFSHAEKIIDENELGTFKNKITLLKAFGLFDRQEALLENITLIQGIRNHYSHHRIIAGQEPEKVTTRIRQLAFLNENGTVGTWNESFDNFKSISHGQLYVCSIFTLAALSNLADTNK